ncbi:MAG: XRE family transcriptional regulator [Ruminococcaceae bacterium]|nr:XRE family transcriptional regulator [Oscillospiraceae bacterium]
MQMIKNLKKLRNFHGISQQQLANVVGVSQQSINKYENQNVEPDISTLIKIADYFSTTVDYLVGRTESTDGAESIVLTHDEHLVISGYRFLNDEEKQIVRLVINNHHN